MNRALLKGFKAHFLTLRRINLKEKLPASYQFGCWGNFVTNFSDVTYIEKGNEDLLSVAIKEASSEQDLIVNMEKHLKVMNNDHLLKMFEKMFILRKENKNSENLPNLYFSQPFVDLCDRIQNRVRFYTSDDIISLLKVSCYLKLPTNSLLVQSLLQMLRYQVNQLTIQNVVYVEFLMSKLDSCPLVDAFQIALPVVFETQLEFQLDSEQMSELVSLLRYAISVKVSVGSVEKIIARMLRFGDKITPNAAVRIIATLCSTKRIYGNESYLVSVLYEVINKNINSLTDSDLHTCVKKIGNVSSLKKKNLFYNESFFDGLCHRIVNEKWDFKIAVETLRKCAAVGHHNALLMDYICQELVQQEESDGYIFDVLKCLHSCASLGYKSPSLASCLSYLDSKENLKEVVLSLKSNFTVVALDMLSQGYFSPVVVNSAVKDLENSQDLDKQRKGTYHAIKLYQTLLAQYPEYCEHELMNHNDVTKMVREQPLKVSPLEGALVAGVGDHECVKSNVLSRNGISIDHILAFRDNKYPMPLAVNSKTAQLCIKDMDLPPDAIMLGIMAIYPHDICRNSFSLRKYLTLEIGNLESEGIYVLTVDVQKWTMLPDREKIPYLMSRINNKLETVSSFQGAALSDEP